VTGFSLGFYAANKSPAFSGLLSNFETDTTSNNNGANDAAGGIT